MYEIKHEAPEKTNEISRINLDEKWFYYFNINSITLNSNASL